MRILLSNWKNREMPRHPKIQSESDLMLAHASPPFFLFFDGKLQFVLSYVILIHFKLE